MPGTSLPADPNTPAVSLTAGLAKQFPRQAEEEAAGITGANTLKMQQLAGGVASGTTTAPNGQQISQAGAQMAADAATRAASAGSAAGQQMLGANSAQLQGEAVQQGAAQAAYRTGAAANAATNSERLSKLSTSTQANLVNRQMQFQTQQVGQGTLNETQLMDWSVKNAQSQQQLQDNMQTIQLANQRYLQMLQVGYQKVSQQLQESEQGRLQNLSASDKLQLQQAKSSYQVAVMKQQAKMKDQQSMLGAAGMIVGAVVGGYVTDGSPVGVAGGAMAGQGLGTALGSMTSNQ